MEEIWKDVEGYEGLYQVSNLGRIKSYKVYSSGKVLSLTNKTGDYFRIVLQGIGKKSKSISIHRLVAQHFIPNPNMLPVVNHIDGNKQNNAVFNLEWCTHKYNVAHAIKMNPDMLNGMISYNKFEHPKRILQITKDGQIINVFPSAQSAGRCTGVCARNILQVANRTPFNDKGLTRKTAGGYIWRFESEVISNDL